MDTILGLRRRLFLASVGVGLAYGLLARLVFGLDALGGLFTVMSLSFIFGVPVVIGFLTIYGAGMERTGGWARWIFLPWLASLLVIVAAMLLAWEGLICAVVWVPLFLVLSSLGGVIGGLARRWGGSPGQRGMVLAAAAVVPFLTAPLEERVPLPTETRVVESRIVIDAPAATVWPHIREVPPIGAEELAGSFAHAVGFPRPIEARLEGDGVGAVRYASFERGVMFVERVTEWVPGRSLAFTIHPEGVPPTAFDQHVAVGGTYFDVLEGRYEIRPLGPGRVELVLTSRQRLSTRFNGYTRLWTDLFMRDIQERILEVVKRRAEADRA